MLSYEAYEKSVFDWLMSKHQTDNNFTFTVRQSATKNSETDYFIGTQRSGYFATTFWSIPVNFPGSSGDAMSLIFVLGESTYTYYFEFTQTQDPKDDQNRAVLNLIKTIKEPLVEKYKLARKINETAKMYTIRIAGLKENYVSLEAMYQDIDGQLADIIAIVDLGILSVKQSIQRFTAHRVTPQEFVSLINKLNQRVEKHHAIVKEIGGEETSVNTETFANSIPMQLNQILYGPPGTGKTYNSINLALSIIEGKSETELSLEDRTSLKARYQRYVDSGQILFTTFHQSMSYEDFVEGIKPRFHETDDGSKQLIYEVESGLFKIACAHAAYNTYLELHSSEETPASAELVSKFNSGAFQKAMANQDIQGKPVVLIIDEINRGNVSAIFGELITLIEESKRAGRDEALEVILPYSKQKFSVPSNLYLIGTMNTADRSVEALDTALRRRFAFEEMMPKAELLGDIIIENINLQHVLSRINNRIKVLLDKDHQIGHSYLINVQSRRDLTHAFNNCIVPLLKEYFYRDEEKIALVLGAGFVEIEKDNFSGDLFPDFDKIRKPQYKTKLNVIEVLEENIIDALNQLIG
ncbi:AAA family ATPase [Sphingobacterium sp.]|uniref:McrB family protein n=1 Tax=Sphingobacterium sp. TaxID=341027 RepID=UPI00258FA488|nr:AAA family ATPase [Sphingobacterium sp.]WET69800.1 MAG: AAA family ATPase [Sphingobacterium sp.]